jgi:hypothetical protein
LVILQNKKKSSTTRLQSLNDTPLFILGILKLPTD